MISICLVHDSDYTVVTLLRVANLQVKHLKLDFQRSRMGKMLLVPLLIISFNSRSFRIIIFCAKPLYSYQTVATVQ